MEQSFEFVEAQEDSDFEVIEDPEVLPPSTSIGPSIKTSESITIDREEADLQCVDTINERIPQDDVSRIYNALF